MLETSLLIVGAYLLGSIPSGYVIGKLAAGIDIREYGSGNVGASNVIAHVGKMTGIAQGLLFDGFLKGYAPVMLGRYVLEVDLWAQCAAGIVAIIGHNWSPFIGFTGGRGVATSMAVTLALDFWIEMFIMGVVSAAGILFIARDTGFWTFVSILAFPIIALALTTAPLPLPDSLSAASGLVDKPPEFILASACISLILLG
ncbi:MAG: glycerol-3-phosphate acyltransferase, partial [Dehalococcoidia bacterium]|nr:glycerol-3-phosphate acyltransferase [Dehalococcoidia bacterium]